MRRVLAAVVILSFVLATLVLVTPAAEAVWNPAGERGEAIFELIPQQGKVHVTLNYHLQNLDPDTRYANSYYTAWNVALLSDAQNIRAYDKTSSLILVLGQTSGNWKTARVNYNIKLFYGVSYDFTVEYDLLGMSSSVTSFLAYGHTYTATVKILIPLGYSTELSDSGYVLEKTPTYQVYTYPLAKDGGRFATEVTAVRKTEYQSLSGSVRLQAKTITITIDYWEGERDKARYILDLYARALPVLEEITAVPFPRSYPVLVKETTKQDIKGYEGVNGGAGGIGIAAERIQDDIVLVHELAHYWARWPPFGELWMHEGYAELYAYLALKKLGKASESDRIMSLRLGDYNGYKDRYTLPLAQWDSEPPVVTKDLDLLSFGYAKSFVFVLGLYEKLGLAALQKFNGEAFATSRPLDWVEFINILSRVAGQDTSPLFAGWVVPGVAQPFGASYDSWQRAEKAYRQAEEVISRSKGALGISEVEQALEQARSLLTSGQYDRVSQQVQVALNLYARWQEAEKAYRKVEETVNQSKGALGIEGVQPALVSARNLLIRGQSEQVISQVEATLKLYEAWQKAEKAYRQAEEAISSSKGVLGMWEVEKALEQARALLVNGQYDGVSVQAEAALRLFARWQEAERAYRKAEETINKSKGALGIESVQQKLDSARNLLVSGQFEQVLSQAEAAVKLYGEWQRAEQAYREAEVVISKSKGALGIETVQGKLDSARNLLMSGQFEQVLSQTEAAIKLYGEWQRTEQTYRQVEKIVASAGGALGIETVEREVALAKALLAEGHFDQALSRSQSTLELYERWQTANTAFQEAARAISVAKQEGRTWRLQEAEVLLGHSSQLLVSGNFGEAAASAQQAKEHAQKAVTPLQGIAPLAVPVIVAIAGLVAFILIRKRMRVNSAKG